MNNNEWFALCLKCRRHFTAPYFRLLQFATSWVIRNAIRFYLGSDNPETECLGLKIRPKQEEKKNRRQMIETVGRADMVIMKKKLSK